MIANDRRRAYGLWAGAMGAAACALGGAAAGYHAARADVRALRAEFEDLRADQGKLDRAADADRNTMLGLAAADKARAEALLRRAEALAAPRPVNPLTTLAPPARNDH